MGTLLIAVPASTFQAHRGIQQNTSARRFHRERSATSRDEHRLAFRQRQGVRIPGDRHRSFDHGKEMKLPIFSGVFHATKSPSMPRELVASHEPFDARAAGRLR